MGVYILTLTAEKMDNETLAPILKISESMLQEKNDKFTKLWALIQEETPKNTGNYIYNAEMHTPQTMQVAFDTWLIGQHDVRFEPEFGENFFPHAMSDPQGRDNYFLYYFDLKN